MTTLTRWRPDYLDKYQVSIPEGESGNWKVEHFTVTDDDLLINNLRAAFSPAGRGHMYPGSYTRLMRGQTIVMSDTADEIRDHLEPIRRAKGLCRVHGLGLGMVAGAMLEKPEVDRVDIVERSPDVIALVAPTLQNRYGERVRIIQADVLEYRPTTNERGYSVIWHDIWDYITTDNLPQMALLHRRWARRTEWQGSWAREIARYEKRREYRW